MVLRGSRGGSVEVLKGTAPVDLPLTGVMPGVGSLL